MTGRIGPHSSEAAGDTAPSDENAIGTIGGPSSREHGALSVRAAVSHCMLSEMAYARLGNGMIDELITTNSVPLETRGLPITRLSVAGLLGEAILRIHSNRSVTGLFKVKGF